HVSPPPPKARLRPEPATTRSIAVLEKLGQARARSTRDRGRGLRSAIRRQFVPTLSAPVLPMSPVVGLRLKSALGPKPDPSNLDRTSDEPQNRCESQRPKRRRGTPAEPAVPLNTS